jgi:hypothetical protein
MTQLRYEWHGWNVGTDVTPEESGKEWLTITEDDEEYCIIVLRTNASIFDGDPEALESARLIRERHAEHIVKALNATPEP